MRYFLDTEFNGWGGALLSLALVPAIGDQEFYVTLNCDQPIEPWVQRNVVPFLDMVPAHLRSERLNRSQAAIELQSWLKREDDYRLSSSNSASEPLELFTDWPEDISQFCNLLIVGPGHCVEVPPLSFRMVPIPGFSSAANSQVPHNALHDARALRDQFEAMR